MRSPTVALPRRPPGRASAIALAALSAGLYTAAQPPFGAAFLGFVCLVPWFFVLRTHGVFAGAASGLLLGLLLASLAPWIPSSLASLGTSKGSGVVALLMSALAAKGLPLAAIGAVGSALRGQRAWTRVAALSGAFFVVESFLSLPPRGIPWGLLGHSQAGSHGVAQLALLGGVPLVSAALAAVSALLCELLAAAGGARGPLGRAFAVALGAFAALTIAAVPLREALHGAAPGGASTLRVLAVQPHLPREEQWAETVQRTHLALAVRTARRALAQEASADLVVLPELIVTSPVDRPGALRDDLARSVRDLGLPLVLGAARSPASGRQDRYRNSLLWMSADGEHVAELDKELGIPVAEAAPVRAWEGALAGLVGLGGRRMEETPGAGPFGPSEEFAAALCYEALFPGLVGARRSDETRAILNLVNDGWLSGELASRQQLAFASFRAIEQGLPMLRVAQGGVSAFIDRYGRIRQEIPHGREGAFSVVLPAGARVGWIEHAGLLLLAALGGSAGLLGALVWERRNLLMATKKAATAALLGMLLALAGARALAQETVATLTLDGLSFLSFGDREVAPLPTGSTIRFRFGSPAADGALPFTIQPGDLAIAPIPVGAEGGTLTYGLAGPASGSIRTGPEGQPILTLSATVTSTLSGLTDGNGTKSYTLQITTEQATATDASGTDSVQIRGVRLVPGANYIQLVTATTNREDAYPEPGAAVHAVLSGTFDRLPALR